MAHALANIWKVDGAYFSLWLPLKERMTSILQQLIPDSQTAFLPERQSAQNLWILQALQQILAQDEDHAILTTCDFRKAYDTISGPFLLEVCAMRFVGFLG